MGVRGLSTFMAANPHLFSERRLHDCSVVIDANNLCHYLYHLFRVDSHLGGDYNFFYAKVVKFLESFRKCNILTYFVFDGAYDPSDAKLKTTMSRAKQRLAAAKQLTRNIFGRKVLPILAFDVLRDALLALKLPHAHSDFEADVQIVALANYLQCPVLSLDSDFYIYDVCHGFVPLDRLDPGVHRSKTNIVPKEDGDGSVYTYMTCRMYSIDRFLKCFDNLDRSKLPLLAAIVGNDNLDYEATLAFFNAVTLPKKVDSRLTFTATQRPILGLLAWLQRSTTEEAVEKMVTCLKGALKVKTRKALLGALSAYSLCSSSLIRHLRLDQSSNDSNGVPPALLASLLTKCGLTVPRWCRGLFQSGVFPPFFLNVLVNRRVFLLAQVENFGQVSSYECSRRLRQVLYGILLADDIAATSDTAPSITETESDTIDTAEMTLPNCTVTEYNRRDRNFCCDYVEPLRSLDRYGSLPGLTSIVTLPRQKNLQLLLEVLGVDFDFVAETTPTAEWSLFVCGVVYWLRLSTTTSRSEVRHFVAALLITAISTSLTATYKEAPRRKNRKRKQSLDDVSDDSETSDVESGKATLPEVFRTLTSTPDNYLDSLTNLADKYQRDPLIDRNHPPNLRGLHWFAELQTCLLYASYLNRVLRGPLPAYRAAHFLNGIFLYNVFADLCSRSKPDDYLALLLTKGSTMYDLFVRLQDSIVAEVDADEPPENRDDEDDGFEVQVVVGRRKFKRHKRKTKGRRRR